MVSSTPPRTAALARLCVPRSAPLLEVLERQAQATSHGLPAGITLVVDEQGVLEGTITDGDVRRALVGKKTLELNAREVMNPQPIVFSDALSYRAVLEQLPVELERRGRRARSFLGKIVLIDEQRRPTRVLDYHELWEQRVATHRHVAVLGLGYVGLTLALELAKEGFQVTGVETDQTKVDALNAGHSHVHEIGLPELLREQVGKRFRVAAQVPEGADVFIVAVGTPVGGDHRPDLSFIESASKAIAKVMRRGALVVLRSTVPVGTTRRVVAPLLEQLTGMIAGRDYHLAFAPERTVEGKALQELRSLPQIIGGINDDSVEATAALFRELTPTQVRVASVEAAELVKLVNNSFRDLIFAFSNEVVRLAAQFNLDATEVIRAANRGYPRDPVPLPSPGVGGPCLTKDPWILATLAEGAKIDVPLMAHGRQVNEAMHAFVADEVVKGLERLGKNPKTASVLVCGLAFKGQPETGDLRNSTPVEIAKLLQSRVGQVLGFDPVATAEEIRAIGIEPVDIPKGFAGRDAVLILNNHPRMQKLDVFSTVRALKGPGLVYDAWRVLNPDDVLQAAPSLFMGLGFMRSSVPGVRP